MSPGPKTDAESAELSARVLGRDLRGLARLLRLVDDRRPLGLETLRAIRRSKTTARVVGITGAPGSGKSTLVDQLITRFRSRQNRVGVVAVDPSSPYSGGALLADRARMQRHLLDPEVFIRSLASRGDSGGLSRSTSDTVTVLEAAGFDPVLVETVGVGQAEVEISALADITVVVLVPGLGDDLQAMKAGLMEAADIFVINKSDRPGADRLVSEVEATLHLLDASPDAFRWTPRVQKTVAHSGEGVTELVAAIDQLFFALEDQGRAKQRRRRRIRRDLEGALRAEVLERLRCSSGGDDAFEAGVDRIVAQASTLEDEVAALLAAL